MRRLACLVPALVAVALVLLASHDAARVELWYARGLYPHVARALAGLTQHASLSVAELAIPVLALVVLLALAWRVRRRGWMAAARRIVAALGLIGVWFLLVWGLNYRRLPFATGSGLDVRPVSVDELAALTRTLTLAANGERAHCAEDEHGVFRLRAGRAAALADAPSGNANVASLYPLLAGPTPRPKAALFSALMPRVGIAGVYVPFTSEPLVDGAMPEAELPFSASHEVAHAQGIAREDEANFVSYLACESHESADFRYSGALVASFYTLAALQGPARELARTIESERSPAVSRDVAAIAAWYARFEGPVRDAGERVNDAYLRSQGARDGVRSYGRMVDLLAALARSRRTAVLAPAP